jgi:hypothetical protein
MKTFRKSFKKNGKGQVLVIVALTLTGLVAIIGLAIDMGYMYISYARLRRAVDAAALAGSGEFKRNYVAARLDGAARQVLYLNLNGAATAGSPDFPDIEVETCDTVATANGLTPVLSHLAELVDIERAKFPDEPGKRVCSDPLKKIVRVTVRENVGTFFLAIIGLRSFPIQVVSVSEAATVDVALVIDTSESMSTHWDGLAVGAARDPSVCNAIGRLYDMPGSCLPFQDVKQAALNFTDNLYFPYDRVSVVTFAKDATMVLPMSGNGTDITNAIKTLKVFEGNQACPYTTDQRTADPSTYPRISGDAVNPCRLYNSNSDPLSPNQFQYFDCPSFYSPNPDASGCPSTNTSDGVALGGAILTGDYSSTSLPVASWPVKRDSALWVMLLLTDGAANSGHDSNGGRICPASENSYAWVGAHPLCRDADALTRHCASAADTSCVNAQYPPLTPTPPAPVGGRSVVDALNYDGDDRARDMFDLVSSNSTLIFTIGMGPETIKNTPRYDINGIAPGVTLLQYGAFGTTNDITNPNALVGIYYYGNSSAELTRIFLAIANNLATRINQ